LIIRCINSSTRTKLSDENLKKFLKNELFKFLTNESNSMGQKLFILNVYLENLEQFGKLLYIFKIMINLKKLKILFRFSNDIKQ